MKRIALSVAVCLAAGSAHGASLWVNPQHPERMLGTEAQLCHDHAWESLPNAESDRDKLVDVSAGTAFCLCQRGWVLNGYARSKD